MDLPASVSYFPVVIVLGAIALMMVISAIRERRYDRRIRRAPRVDRVTASLAPVGALAHPHGEATPDAHPETLPVPGSETDVVTADLVRRIVDPSLPSTHESYPWSPAVRDGVFAEMLDGSRSRLWSKAESDGLVALFHLGIELTGLAEEMGVEEHVLIEELVRRLGHDQVDVGSRRRAADAGTEPIATVR